MVQKENIGRRGLANSLHYYVHIILIIYTGDTGLKSNAVTRGLKGDLGQKGMTRVVVDYQD